MDADGLPIIGPGIDFTKVEAINQKRTLAFLNHFVTHTARFMNKFSCVCEEKLADLCVRIQRLETSMSILEAKLSSIPGLENVTVATTSVAQEQKPPVSSETSESQPSPEKQQTTSEKIETDPEPETETPKMTVSQDPRYARFFKMLNMGVPLPAVSQKMIMEGLDPDVLNDPNAPSTGQSNQNNDSDSDFSEEDEQSDDSSVHFSDDN